MKIQVEAELFYAERQTDMTN